jgi:hypothetical protein
MPPTHSARYRLKDELLLARRALMQCPAGGRQLPTGNNDASQRNCAVLDRRPSKTVTPMINSPAPNSRGTDQ